MTAFSQVINNMLNPFSNAGELSLWGSMVWGQDPWGYTPEKPPYEIVHVMAADGPVLSSAQGAFDVVHYVVADGPVLSSAKGPFDIVHLMEADGPVLDSSLAFEVVHRTTGSTLTVASSRESGTLSDNSGYEYATKILTSYTVQTPTDVTWTVSGTGSTVWS